MSQQKTLVDSAVRKAFIRLMPFLGLMYVLSFIDRSNIGYAKAELQIDAGLSNAAFAFGAGIFFVGYCLLEVPSNIIMTKVGARVWLARIMITWGLISAALMFVEGPTSFYILRFLLGAAEAGFFPGVILYLTFWFPSRFRGRATGMFYFGVPVALAVGSLLSGFLLEMDGLASLRGWQWMFMIEGLAASVVGVIALFVLSDRPADAKWLDPAERDALQQALDAEDAVKQKEGPTSAMSALKNLKVLHFTAVFLFIQIGVYGMIFYLPTMVRDLLGTEASDIKVGLVAAIPWAVSIVGTFFVTRWSDRTGIRTPVVLVLWVVMAIALAASVFLPTPLAIIALSIAAVGYFAATPIFWTIPSAMLSGVAAAGGIALISSVGNLGGFVAPNLKTWFEEFTDSSTAGIVLMGVMCLLAVVILLPTLRNQPSEPDGSKVDLDDEESTPKKV